MAVLRQKKTNAFDLLDSFVKEVNKHGKTPVLMIDEANFLDRNPKENLEIMDKLVVLTKQENKILSPVDFGGPCPSVSLPGSPKLEFAGWT